MKNRDVMKSKVETLRPSQTAKDAAQCMRDKNIGFIPISDENMVVLGTITDRDLAIRILAEDRPNDARLEDVMSKDVVACSPDDDLDEALELMARNRKSRIVCVDHEGKLKGVISLSDIAQRMDSSAGRTLREVTQREAHA